MSYASFALATFDNLLGTLADLIGKAEQSGKSDLMAARLADDMFPLATQVRVVSFQTLNTINRLSGSDHAIEQDDPETLADARAMVERARSAAQTADADAFLPADAPVDFDLPNGMAFAMTAHEYVRDWSIPQFYFHLMTFYAILRAQGVSIGKIDFMPYMMQHAKKPAPAG